MKDCGKKTLDEVREDLSERVNIYINSLKDKNWGLDKYKGKNRDKYTRAYVGTPYETSFVSITPSVGESGYDIELKKEGFNKIVTREYLKLEIEVGQTDESITPISTPIQNTDEYNFEGYLKQRKELKNYIEEKIKLLQNEELKGDGKKQIEQIAYFKNIAVNLYKDIKELSKPGKDVENFIDNIENDIENIKILLRNPTLENLALVDRYNKIISFLTDTNKEGFLNSSFTKLLKENPYLANKITAIQATNTSNEKKHKDAETTALLNLIEHHIKQKNLYGEDATEEFLKEKAKELFEEQFERAEELGAMKYLTRMDKQEQKNVIVSAIKKQYTDSVIKNGMKTTEEKLILMEKKVADRLVSLGNFIGGFFNKKATWDIFKEKSADGHRLINPFTVTWQKLKKDLFDEQIKISKLFYSSKGIETDTLNTQIDNHYNKIMENADFIDTRLLPELINNRSFQEFLPNFKEIGEAENYKRQLIDRLGEREYEKLVKEATNKLDQYIIGKKLHAQNLMAKYKITDINSLQAELLKLGKEGEWNYYTQEIQLKSPFLFASNHFDKGSENKVDKYFHSNGKAIFSYNNRVNLEYTTYIPKQQHEDSDFNVIKNDPLLLEAWGLMDTLVEHSNRNGTAKEYETDLDTDIGYTGQETHILRDVVGILSPSVLINIKNITRKITSLLSGKPWQEETGDERIIKGGRKTTERKIQSQYKSILEIEGVKEKDLSDNEKLKFRVQATEFVVKNLNENNLLQNIVTSSQISGAFKARKEILTTLQFLSRKLGEAKGRKNFNEIVDFYINKNIFGINNRGKTDKGWFRAEFKLIKHYPKETEALRKFIKEKMKVTKDKKELSDLQEMYDKDVVYVNGRDITEAIIFKLTAFTAFALNLNAQIKNKAIAEKTAVEVDGKPGFWLAGVYRRAVSWDRKYKSQLNTKEGVKQRKIYNLFLMNSNLIQSSVNEVYRHKVGKLGKIGDTRSVKALKEISKNPTNFVTEIEKQIQRPQIIALMTGLKIKNDKGVEFNLFDIKSGDFPAFDIHEETGELILKPEFAKVKGNKETFLQFTSQQAANMFGEGGHIPAQIAYINGDYRDDTTYLAQKKFMGALLLMFKKWAIETTYKQADMFKNLAKNDQVSALAGTQIMKSLVYSGISGSAGSLFLGTSLGVGVAAGSLPVLLAGAYIYYTNKQKRIANKELDNDIKELQKIYVDLKKVNRTVSATKIMKGSLTTATVLLSTIAQGLSLTFSKVLPRDLINSDRLKSIIYIDKTNLKEKTVGEIKDDLYFLQTSTAYLLRNAAYMAMAYALANLVHPGFDDDEEEEKYKKIVDEEGGVFDKSKYSKNKFNRYLEMPVLTSYYLANNLLDGVNDDMSFTENALGIQKMGKSGAIENLISLTTSIINNDEYETGKRIGDKKWVVKAKRMITPAFVNTLGLDYNTKNNHKNKGVFDESHKSDYKKLKEFHKKLKSEAVENLIEEIKESDLTYKEKIKIGEGVSYIDKEKRKLGRDKFPGIKLEDFYSTGVLKPTGMDKVRPYYDDLPKELRERIFGQKEE